MIFALPLYDDNPTERLPVVTWFLIGLCVGAFLWQLGQNQHQVLYSYGLIPAVLLGSAHLAPHLRVLPPWATVVAVTVSILAGAWEWSAFLRLRTLPARVLYVVAVAACLPVLWQLTLTQPSRLLVLVAALLWWVVALLWVVFAPRRAAAWSAALAGLLALAPAWMALVRLRIDVPRGEQWLLFALCLVWAADVGAYFAGRSFGRRRLAPQVSSRARRSPRGRRSQHEAGSVGERGSPHEGRSRPSCGPTRKPKASAGPPSTPRSKASRPMSA